MARPLSTAPQPLGGGLTPGAGTSPTAATVGGLPADVNASWRNMMTTLGSGLPHGLNRGLTAARRLHRAVR